MVIFTNFDSLAITYPPNMSRLLQTFHFPIEVVSTSLQTQKGLELIFRSQFLWNVFKKFVFSNIR